MMRDVFGFVWLVPVEGHCWVKDRMQPRKAEPGQISTSRLYRPMEEKAALFRIFAKVPATDRDAILKFADKYGSLGLSGDTLEQWTQAIEDMRRAVEFWDLVAKGDVTGLKSDITWRKYPEVYRIKDPDKGDWFIPAAYLVRQWVDSHLEGHTSTRLYLDVEPGKDPLVIQPDKLGKHHFLQIEPDSLLSAMWLQFARSIAGDTRFHACKRCGKTFEISRRTKFRTNREFCSDTCKVADYRRRKGAARQLRSEGKSVATIAKELQTKLKTIRQWIARQLRSEGKSVEAIARELKTEVTTIRQWTAKRKGK